MSVPIEINYKNNQKPRGMVGPRQSIKVNSAFQVFSQDGPMTFEFRGDSPFAEDRGVLPGNTDFLATKPGRYKFKCTINIDGHPVELDPDNRLGIGGEMEVIP